jgi:hypothetical protein
VTAWRLFWLSLALMLTGLALIFFWSVPRIEASGIEPFDVRTGGYSYDEAADFLIALTDAGRAAYLGPQRLADTLFPLGFFGVLASATYLALYVRGRIWAGLTIVVPGVYLVFDLLENAAVAGLLRAGADGITPEMVERASSFTQWKFLFVNAALFLLAAVVLVRAAVRLRGRI